MIHELDVPYYIELQRRFEDISLYISYHESNFGTYSIRIENLFVDICAFFDSLCQTFIRNLVMKGHDFIQKGNVKDFDSKITKKNKFNIVDYYWLLNTNFKLADRFLNLNIYEDNFYDNPQRGLPDSVHGYFVHPYKEWCNAAYYPLPHWKAFTELKHDRLSNMKVATFLNTINALGAVYIILTLKNEEQFFSGYISEELYKIFFPKYRDWKWRGRLGSGNILWEKIKLQ